MRQEKRAAKNLIPMTVIFSSSVFCLYLIVFYLKYVPGDLFLISYASGFPEMLFLGLAAPLLKKVGIRRAFAIGFSSAAVGAVGLIFLGPENPAFSPLFIFTAKAGICITFTLCFVATDLMYPSAIAATCLGITNITARILAIFSSVVAEMD